MSALWLSNRVESRRGREKRNGMVLRKILSWMRWLELK
jgi:hypothetical protein